MLCDVKSLFKTPSHILILVKNRPIHTLPLTTTFNGHAKIGIFGQKVTSAYFLWAKNILWKKDASITCPAVRQKCRQQWWTTLSQVQWCHILIDWFMPFTCGPGVGTVAGQWTMCCITVVHASNIQHLNLVSGNASSRLDCVLCWIIRTLAGTASSANREQRYL